MTAQQSQLLHIHQGENTQASKSASYQMALRTQDGDALGGMVHTFRINYKVLKPACFNTVTVTLLFENTTNLGILPTQAHKESQFHLLPR